MFDTRTVKEVVVALVVWFVLLVSVVALVVSVTLFVTQAARAQGCFGPGPCSNPAPVEAPVAQPPAVQTTLGPDSAGFGDRG